MSTGWSLFVAALAAFNILGCAWLLFVQRQARGFVEVAALAWLPGPGPQGYEQQHQGQGDDSRDHVQFPRGACLPRPCR